MKAAFALVLLVLIRFWTALSLLTLNPKIFTPPVPSMKFNGGLWLSRRPSVVGLVGGIASGKSTVSRVLADCGVAVIDADKLGHESYQPGTRCFSNLVNEFGSKIVAGDGTIDRRALGQAVRAMICRCSRAVEMVKYSRVTYSCCCCIVLVALQVRYEYTHSSSTAVT